MLSKRLLLLECMYISVLYCVYGKGENEPKLKLN